MSYQNTGTGYTTDPAYTGHTTGTHTGTGVGGMMHGIKEKIPGTAEHKLTHPAHANPVGQVKAHIPGTTEYKMTHPTAAGTGIAGAHGTGARGGSLGTGLHTGTGESLTHKIAKHIPGTQANAEKKALEHSF
eukprot:jgi/Botrbrau1/11095/Bobra.0219s0005.1